ncbi:MAG TPA: acyltransferase, partial [Anaeromyxobacter sp.]
LGRRAGAAALLAFAAALALLAWGGVPYPILHNGALVPLVALVVLGVARSGGPVSRALGSGPARILGDASFGLYALQEPLWLWARRLAAAPGTGASAAFVIAFAAAAIAISVCVSSAFERPARRVLRAVLAADGPTRRRAREEPPSAARASPPPTRS